MKTLSYAPQHIDADELNGAIELDSSFIVNDDGTLELSGNFAPDVWGEQGHADPVVEDDFAPDVWGQQGQGWEFFSRGYTGQHGYNGPEMHQSEYLGGRLADDILATPGEYAVVGVNYDCDEDMCGEHWDPMTQRCPEFPHVESWVVVRRDA